MPRSEADLIADLSKALEDVWSLIDRKDGFPYTSATVEELLEETKSYRKKGVSEK